MEERYWRQFWETGKVTDYLSYKDVLDKNNFGSADYPESEDKIESDYSDRNGAVGNTYR